MSNLWQFCVTTSKDGLFECLYGIFNFSYFFRIIMISLKLLNNYVKFLCIFGLSRLCYGLVASHQNKNILNSRYYLIEVKATVVLLWRFEFISD